MSLDALMKHLSDPAPGFRCYECIDRSETILYTATVFHQLQPPASSEALDLCSRIMHGFADQFLALARLHDGIRLHCDPHSETAGIEIFPIAQWEAKQKEMHNWFGEDEEIDMPDWFHHGIVFGDIPNSANYLVLGMNGSEAGKIYYFDHDDYQEEPLAEDLFSLLDMLVNDPVQFYLDRGCYARYFDGTTRKQWVPAVYVPNLNAIAP